ncbi:hypothetical protein AB1Y20_020564 [Prymnesium parvum]|uniref:C3H1-type domain-containing protein n=1 Tax=Prymnesium parvum TaxID=97485 RepID=A0AB34JUY3_PRYPA
MSLAGIRFVSKAELDERKEKAREAREAREAAALEEARERRQELRDKLKSGEGTWVAPAVERRLKGEEKAGEKAERKHKKEHKHKRHKREKGEKHRHHRREHAQEEGSHSDSSSNDEPNDRAHTPAAPSADGGEGAAPPPAPSVTASAARSAAGLDWMLRAPPRAKAPAAEPSAAADEEHAPAQVSKRVALELNPYAKDGLEVNEWKKPDGAVTDQALANLFVKGTDGGRSFLLKKMQRAVEEAMSTNTSLEQVCLDRFGDLEMLPELQQMAAEGGQREYKRGAHALSHLHAQKDRARDAPPMRRRGYDFEDEPGSRDKHVRDGDRGGDRGKGICFAFEKGTCTKGDACKFSHSTESKGSGNSRRPQEPDSSRGQRGFVRPKLSGSLRWQASAPEAPPAQTNTFANDGSFLQSSAASIDRQSFLYGPRADAAESRRSEGKEELTEVKRQPLQWERGEAQEKAGLVESQPARCCSEPVAACSSNASSQGMVGAAPSLVPKPTADSGAHGLINESVDVNKLAAKAMKAKLVGNLAEHDRLQALIAAAPRPEHKPPSAELQAKASGGITTVELAVPATVVGVIIGKAGATIDALQRESGARIRVTQEPAEPGSASVVVLLSGSEGEIARAQQLIQSKLDEKTTRDVAKGGKAVKAMMRKRKPEKEYEDVPEFDRKTGQLTVVRKLVEKDELAEVNSAPDPASTRRPKKLQRYEDGEKKSYFGDDDGKSLKDMVEAERRGSEKHMDDNTADAISRQKKFKGVSADDEYDYDEGVQMSDTRQSRQSEAKRQMHAKSAATREERQLTTAAELAEDRFNKAKHLVISLGNHTYLRLQDLSPITPGHCVIEAIESCPSLVGANEEIADEVRNFQKCLIQFCAEKGKCAVFVESYFASQRHKSAMKIECIPLDERDAKAAPGFFKKAILESEGDWSQHRKLYDTKGSIRGTVPPGFSYFAVTFGLQAGYAHVVEDDAAWPPHFGRDVLEGLLEHRDTGIPLQRRRREEFAKVKQLVTAFGQAFDPFDWTKAL